MGIFFPGSVAAHPSARMDMGQACVSLPVPTQGWIALSKDFILLLVSHFIFYFGSSSLNVQSGNNEQWISMHPYAD